MKALTLTQPWASLVAGHVKYIETRHWTTSYRGPLAIHAAKTFGGLRGMGVRQTLQGMCDLIENDPELYAACEAAERQPRFGALVGRGGAFPLAFPLGRIVAIATLGDVVPTEDLGDIARLERACGNYAPGRYGWILSGVLALPNPPKVKGGQGLWTLPHGVLDLDSLGSTSSPPEPLDRGTL